MATRKPKPGAASVADDPAELHHPVPVDTICPKSDQQQHRVNQQKVYPNVSLLRQKHPFPEGKGCPEPGCLQQRPRPGSTKHSQHQKQDQQDRGYSGNPLWVSHEGLNGGIEEADPIHDFPLSVRSSLSLLS